MNREEIEVFYLENSDQRLSVRAESITMRQVLSSLINAPYPALKVLIPGLEEKDCRGASLPNLKHVFDLLIEVNGVAWFEKFVKNSLAPILPDITRMLVASIKGALASSTETSQEPSGEKA